MVVNGRVWMIGVQGQKLAEKAGGALMAAVTQAQGDRLTLAKVW
jgi:hypothetical protein